MPRAEVGTTKHLNNKLKSKGLQRLRWYCQVCERQMRDENGFKCHTQSESHVRQMLVVGEDPRKAINDFSNQFQKDFIQLLRTAHGEKKVNINHFYQEYIANKEHIHMNSTKWPSLTEFAKFLGKEGICRVEDTDKGLQVAWIDNSPDALRRQDAIRKKERQDRGDEEREQRLIKEQVERAKLHAGADGKEDAEPTPVTAPRTEGEKIKLDFTIKPAAIPKPPSPANGETAIEGLGKDISEAKVSDTANGQSPAVGADTAKPAAKFSMGMGLNKPKNVFAAASKKNAFGVTKGPLAKPQEKKPMSEAERIMKEEIERKRAREGNGPDRFAGKRQKV